MPHYETLDISQHRSATPRWIYSVSEPARLAKEAASLAGSLPWLLSSPRGDGHAVLVLPGFIADDLSTALLRGFLDRLGYRTYAWSLGRNTGGADLQERLVWRLMTVTEAAGAPISLIGQSLGGVFARELARRFADRIRQVVCLGSPFATPDGSIRNPRVRRLFEQLSGSSATRLLERILISDPGEPPPVPSTAVYSRSDGVVDWQTCLERDRPRTSNIEVYGSHSGMALQPAVLHAIADRLAQPADGWQRFDRSAGLRACLYPEPEYAAG